MPTAWYNSERRWGRSRAPGCCVCRRDRCEMGRPPGTTVFVGNISYETTEEQLRDVFSQVGNVVSFRLMYDHETGRAKGFGFAEYEDKETAMSARRNLNGAELNGRSLRVDLTESDKQSASANGALPAPAGGAPPQIQPPHLQAHPALPGSLASQNPSMAMMSLAEIHDTMVHLKRAIVKNPNEIRELLLSSPQLAHAILQGQIMLGMVPPPLMPPPPSQQQQQGMPMPPGMPARGMMPSGPPPPLGPPGPPGQQGPPPQAQQVLDEQTALLNRVMSMTPQQIASLPPDQRDHVLQLQATVNSQLAAQGPGRPGPGPPQQMSFR